MPQKRFIKVVPGNMEGMKVGFSGGGIHKMLKREKITFSFHGLVKDILKYIFVPELESTFKAFEFGMKSI